MLSEIETGILALFDEKVLLPFRKMKVGGGAAKKALSIPKAVVGIQGGQAERLTPDVFKVGVRIFVYLEFANLRDEMSRRQASYPIVLAVISYLIGQRLGLEITPLKFVRFDNTTSESEVDIGLINFTLEFQSSFEMRKLPDEEAAALLMLGIEYYLRPGDEVADLEGVADLT